MRGKLHLEQGRFVEAQRSFDRVYTALPGELAPRLALAQAAELCQDWAKAQDLYFRVLQTDGSYSSAAFGLARCAWAGGQRTKALDALRSIPATSTLYGRSRLDLVQLYLQVGPQSPTIAQALLLTDGQNDSSDQPALALVLEQCQGQFQCDCRGVGTGWHVKELKAIAECLLGSTDIIPEPAQMAADFQAILGNAARKSIREIRLQLWTPRGAEVVYCKQVSPEIAAIVNSKLLGSETLDTSFSSGFID